MTNEWLNTDAYEQLYLLNIESQNKRSIIDVENFCMRLKQHDATSQDLLSITILLRTYETYFLSYEPIAQRLNKIGKTQLSKRLNEILGDIRETSIIFKQMNQNMLCNTDDHTHEDIHLIDKTYMK